MKTEQMAIKEMGKMGWMDIIWCDKASYDNHWCYIEIALKAKRNLLC